MVDALLDFEIERKKCTARKLQRISFNSIESESILGLSDTLFKWFKRAKVVGIPITCSLSQAKAKEIAQGLGGESFKPVLTDFSFYINGRLHNLW